MARQNDYLSPAAPSSSSTAAASTHPTTSLLSSSIDSTEHLKRRFIRQNRELARTNATQAIQIRNLELELSRLLAENLAVKERAIRAEEQLERWRRKKNRRSEIDAADLRPRDCTEIDGANDEDEGDGEGANEEKEPLRRPERNVSLGGRLEPISEQPTPQSAPRPTPKLIPKSTPVLIPRAPSPSSPSPQKKRQSIPLSDPTISTPTLPMPFVIKKARRRPTPLSDPDPEPFGPSSPSPQKKRPPRQSISLPQPRSTPTSPRPPSPSKQWDGASGGPLEPKTRRSRPRVSYAEPSLKKKMRRSGVGLTDAVVMAGGENGMP